VKVFVLMADGGYDGDALLGVYETWDEAERNGTQWTPPDYMRDYSPYVIACELGDVPTLRDRSKRVR
jgi:hypothetical protein